MIYFGIGMSLNYASSLDTILGTKSGLLASLRRTPGWGEGLEKALSASDTESQTKYSQEVMKLAYDDAMFLVTHGRNTPWFSQKYVHNAGYFTVGHPMDWTPAKCWLSK
jgi:hypothetical protein